MRICIKSSNPRANLESCSNLPKSSNLWQIQVKIFCKFPDTVQRVMSTRSKFLQNLRMADWFANISAEVSGSYNLVRHVNFEVF